MRISAANISVQGGKHPTSINPLPAAKTTGATDSYNKNTETSSPPIIDAEFVEFYSPSATLFSQERHVLDDTLAPENSELNPPTDNSFSATAPALSKYQLKSYDAPPAGSYIDIFA